VRGSGRPSDAPQSAQLTSLRWRPFRLPLRHRFEAAHSVLASREGVLLELRDADGTTGIGEASPFPSLGDGTVADVVALLEARAAAVLTDPERALAVLEARAPGVAALRCAVDAALLDLEARRRGIPVARLLVELDSLPAAEAGWRPFGNAPIRDSVAVNAVIGGGTPEEVAAFGADAVAAGYDTLKVKVGIGDVLTDVARIATLRLRCPRAAIRLDANGAWIEEQAREALTRLAPLRVELVEQPVAADDLRAMARLRAHSLPQSAYAAPDGGGLRGLVGIPLAADEAVDSEESARTVLEAGAADVLVLKPMRLGGIRPAFAIARRAAEAGVGCIVTTTFDSSVGTAVALQVAAVLPAAGLAHGLSTGEHLAADIVSRPLLPSSGRMALPDEPGLGVTLDYARLETVATGPWVERLR
jgi:L-alanine-DL-glutamate epimerase-like enolase superfamily enzyme